MVERTGSTNADILCDPTASEGDWLIAGTQDAGRGRQGRPWVSAKGNFFGSTLVTLGSDDPIAPTLSLVASLALAEAIDVAAPGQAIMLKWPNDLLVLGRKAAGILLERGGDRVAVGFGVNLAKAPPLADRQTARIDGELTPAAFAPLLAGAFSRLLRLWRDSEPLFLAQAWLARAHPVGSALTVHAAPGETIAGRFDGLEPDGALRLRREDGTLEVIRAGDVEL
jgi:BirA family biotin operon repressor/biotin-[acetyl-CoA-carboxylase] ligase